MTDQQQPAQPGQSRAALIEVGRREHQPNPAAPVKVAKAERSIMALELRKQGANYRQVAARMKQEPGISTKYSEAQAHRDVMFALKHLLEQVDNSAKEYRQLELERLDELWKKWYPKALQGDSFAFNNVMRIIETRIKLLGLAGLPPNINLNLDVAKLNDEQLERLAHGEDPVSVLAVAGIN